MWQAVLSAVLALGILLLLLVVRTRHLTRHPGVFECALRIPPQARVRPGWGRYRAGALQWCPLVSLGISPRHSWRRDGFEILDAVPGTTPLGVPVRRVHVRTDAEEFVLVVPEDTYAGLRSWIESGPPSWESVEGPAQRGG